MSEIVWKLQEGDLVRVWPVNTTWSDSELLEALSKILNKWFEGKKVACCTDESGDQIAVISEFDVRRLRQMKAVKLHVRDPQPRRSGDTQWYLPQGEKPSSKVSKISELRWDSSVPASKAAMGTRNLIREIVDKLDMSDVPKDREFISVSIGDPSIYRHLRPAKEVTGAVERSLLSRLNNGYHPSTGMQVAREALARKFALDVPNGLSSSSSSSSSLKMRPSLTKDDVFLSCGCSQAIEMAICSLMDRVDSLVLDDPSQAPIILLPKPGFPLYQTVCRRHGIEFDFYRLMEENDWEMDIDYLRRMMNSRNVKAILVNNPSNPCGSVFSKENLECMMQLCQEFNVTVIADEIYGGMVHSGRTFYSCASLLKGRNVPVLHLSGLAKLYLVPGWRVGWVICYDTLGGKLSEVRTALQKLSMVILGPATVIQAAIPSILNDTPQSYYNQLNRTLQTQGEAMTRLFEECPGLTPVPPKGAMYLMVGLDLTVLTGFDSDVEFAGQLLKEEAILVLPGTVFGMPNFFRVVCCAPMNVIDELSVRFKRFCKKHSRSLTAKL